MKGIGIIWIDIINKEVSAKLKEDFADTLFLHDDYLRWRYKSCGGLS